MQLTVSVLNPRELHNMREVGYIDPQFTITSGES